VTQVKLFDPFPRARGTTLQAFSDHWSTVHARIAREQIPQIRHYVQSHRVEAKPQELGNPLGETWCDGSSETWYDSPAELQQMIGEAGVAALMRDEENFMDLSVIRHPVVTHEHLVDAGRQGLEPTGVKVLLFTRRAAGTAPDEFLKRWLGDDDVNDGRTLGVTRHVVCTALPETYTFLHPNPEVRDPANDPYDGVRELWWSSRDAIAAAAKESPDTWARLVDHEAADVSRSFALVAQERVIIP
jgi:EthD domain